MSGKKSRTKGHAAEREHLQWMRDLWEEVLTSRNGSKARDAEGVDFINTDPCNFQSKRCERIGSIYKILKEMPEDSNYNVVLHRRNREEWTATLLLDDLIEIFRLLKGNGAI